MEGLSQVSVGGSDLSVKKDPITRLKNMIIIGTHWNHSSRVGGGTGGGKPGNGAGGGKSKDGVTGIVAVGEGGRA